jgi:hypothetical protein
MPNAIASREWDPQNEIMKTDQATDWIDLRSWEFDPEHESSEAALADFLDTVNSSSNPVQARRFAEYCPCGTGEYDDVIPLAERRVDSGSVFYYVCRHCGCGWRTWWAGWLVAARRARRGQRVARRDRAGLPHPSALGCRQSAPDPIAEAVI